MRNSTWSEWNLDRIESHGLTADEIEASFSEVIELQERKAGSYPDVCDHSGWSPELYNLALQSTC